MINYSQICNRLLDDLDNRSQEIIKRRFGLGQEKREPLQAIGNDHNITRERVRQIENHAITRVKSKKNILQPVSDLLYNEFKKRAGVAKEDSILSELGGDQYRNYVFFFLTIGDPFYRFKETDRFYTFWTINKMMLDLIQEIEKNILSQLSLAKRLVTLNEIAMPSKLEKEISYNDLPYFLEISKNILKSPDGYYGLSQWPELNPKGIRDKIYVILKKKQKPLHFKELADEVNRFSFSLGKPKKVSYQSVHNELIRDDRFILIGRGIYALKDSGYKPGPAKDLIAEVLREAKTPLSRDEIIQRIKKISLIKESTIISNLNNRNLFSKNKEGKYFLVKS